MEVIAKSYSDELPKLKKCVEDWRTYFQENIRRFNTFTRFVFKSSLTDDEAATLGDRGMPTIEFNILEAMVSKLRGEFSKQQPALSVRAADGIPLEALTPDFVAQIELVESHIRAIFFDGTNDMLFYNIYSDLLAGGFSVAKCYTDYVNDKSFEQNICWERPFDVTMCGFDPMARDSHKGDGAYCFEIYPLTKVQFIEEFGEEALEGIKFIRSIESFSWSYKNDREDVILVCDYYKKIRKAAKLFQLANDKNMFESEYEEFIENWVKEGRLEQPPAIVSERKTNITTIRRYRFCETRLLKKPEDTKYKQLPLVFIDGNSFILNEHDSSSQMTRPYVYHAMGIQRLKNLAGQSLGNELENTIQHKWMACVEGIPEDYQEPYQNVQKADILLYNHFADPNTKDITLPPPQAVQRPPIPPEIPETFRMTDEMTQMILGSYGQSSSVASAPMSGVAWARSAISSNTASTTYLVGFLKGLGRMAQDTVGLMPIYYKKPRVLPVLRSSGKREDVQVNVEGNPSLDYDSDALQVKVDVGVNFAMQKEIALQTIDYFSKSIPVFADFIGKKGLQTILDNIDIRGIDGLKEKAEEYEKEMAKQQQQQQQVQQMQMQMQMQAAKMALAKQQKELQAPSDAQIALMAVQEKAQSDAAANTIKERDAQTNFLKTINEIQSSQDELQIKQAEIDAENARTAIDSMLNVSQHLHEIKNMENSKDDIPK